MAKTIKFNLILDNYPVRNLEGLREHFSIEDMLKYYDNGLLVRWLNVRGYDKQCTAVEAIDKSGDRKEIIISLIKIFEVVDLSIADIEKAICILSYLDKEKELNKEYKKNAFAKKQVIEDYHAGYKALLMHMEENKDNIALLKADVIQIEQEYYGLFELNYYELFFRFLSNAPKAIFVILTRDAFREFWIGEKANEKIYTTVKNELLQPNRAKQILGEDLRIVKRNTQAMWDPIERPEVKVMVIHITNGTFVKNANDYFEKKGSQDVNDKLVKFDGLSYQCNNQSYELLYMEV